MKNQNRSKTNIIFILSDDQGAWAMGCAGNSEIKTPNLDRLAATGMRFENFYCTSPVCSPARASILTGRIPSQHGIHDFIAGGGLGENAIEYLQGQPGYTDILSCHGYVCALSGKWHLGDNAKPQKGFSRWYAHQRGSGPYYDAPMIRDGELMNEPGYITDKITDEALLYMDEFKDGDQPFYIGIHYTAPHGPFINNHPKEIVALYDDCPFETCPQEPLHQGHTELTQRVQQNIRGNLQGYYAAITAMDINIGRILDKLDTLGLRENTLICFMSDNGFSCGQHGFWGKGNGTFPLNMYDSSVKVPAIFNHAGQIPEGIVCDALVSQYDFMPTLLEYVGLQSPDADKLPGKSFLPLLQGKQMKINDSIIICDPVEKFPVVYDEYGPVRMIRNQNYKYVHRYPYGPHELYDLLQDPKEKTNLINDPGRQDIVEDMKAQLDEWFLRYVKPELDGTHEAVYGRGQRTLAGPAGKGIQAFNKLKSVRETGV
ncbi:MAG: sulfatase-like hydrolase/transferase [Desulfotomaculaceae bacterium]|nr:sulfatase-like hydrolase/transferase [Desulfotomaculaceae bacterium]